jgi:RHS repeat-associated protein
MMSHAKNVQPQHDADNRPIYARKPRHITTPFGDNLEVRDSWGITNTTKYHFTGQREESAIGLYFYNARWYEAALGRFAQPDTIIPQPGNPQSLNRYSYVLNNALRFQDPSGYDPLDATWAEAFRAAHGGRDPTDQDRRDRLFSLIFLGSGADGTWTEANWTFYTANRADLWSGAQSWPGEMVPGVERFAVHVQRLASEYKPDEGDQFVAAFGFVWAGVPPAHPIQSALHFATRAWATATWEAYPPLHEGTADWRPELTDPDGNPSHHYAGFFYVGYFFGYGSGSLVNWLRDGSLSSRNDQDLLLGDIAAWHGGMLCNGRFSSYALGHVIQYALSVRAHIWPMHYPY